MARSDRTAMDYYEKSIHDGRACPLSPPQLFLTFSLIVRVTPSHIQGAGRFEFPSPHTNATIFSTRSFDHVDGSTSERDFG